LWLAGGEPMAELGREFGISRKTGYKIFDRYQECGVEGLTDRSRRPYRYANQLPYAPRRLQTRDEQRVHSIRYQRHGCMMCTRSDAPHAGLGMCPRCYGRRFQLRKRILNTGTSRVLRAPEAGTVASGNHGIAFRLQ